MTRRGAVGWAHGVVIDRTLRLTRGLPDAIARDRFDQIASDLWEHEHDFAARGRSPLATAASILLRSARGIPADLGWRWRELAEARRTASPVPARPWTPLRAEGRPFDQTNGSVDLDEAHPRADDGAEVRDLLAKGVAANAAFGLFGGGRI